jgi:hypothetical protein
MEWKRISDGNLPNSGWIVFGHENMYAGEVPRVDFMIHAASSYYFATAKRLGYTHYFTFDPPTPSPETPSPQPQSPGDH